MQDIRKNNLAGKLNNISSTADAAAGSTVYDAAFVISKDVHAFRHRTYMDMNTMYSGYQGEKRVTEPAFKVVSNVNDQTFYISKQGGKMSDYITPYEECGYAVTYGAACTTDGRHVLPATKEALDPLLSRDKSNNPLNFLEGELKKDKESVLGAAKIILTTQNVWGGDGEYQHVFLQDSQRYGTVGEASSYMKDNNGNPQYSREFNLKERLTNSEQSLEKNTTNTVTVPLRDGKGLREIRGIYVASDHAGPDAGWKLESIKLSVEGISATVNNANQWFLSNSYVENKFSLYGPDASSSGACRIITKTADRKDAGSDSEMKIRIHSKEDNSWTNWITFSEFHDNGADPIERGRLDSFNVVYDKIEFSSNGSGNGEGPKYHFEVNTKMKNGTWTFTPTSRSATVGTVHGSSKYDTEKLRELLQELKDQLSDSSLHVSSKEKGILANAFLKKLAEDQNGKGRTLVFSHEDENGNILYQWVFDGSAIGDFDRDVDLSLTVTADDLGAYGITKTDGTVVLNFSHSKELPEGTRVRIPAATYGFAPGDELHFYYYNPESKELEELFFEGGLTVGEDGYVELDMAHCSEYVLSKYSKEELLAKGSSGSFQQTSASAPERKDGKAAKTGDTNSSMPVLVLVCAALAATSAVLYKKRKSKPYHK